MSKIIRSWVATAPSRYYCVLQDKKRVSEENLRLSSMVATMPTDRRLLAEKLASLESECVQTPWRAAV